MSRESCELFPKGVDDEGNFCRMSNECDCGVTAEPMAGHTRQALLMVLYCHQGSRSQIGQPIRKMLGKGQFERLTDQEVAQAEWILTKVVMK